MIITYNAPSVSVTIGSAPSASVSTGIPVVKEYIDTEQYEGSYTVTPTESTQTLETEGKRMTDDVTVNPIPPQYIVPSGSQTVTENNTYNVTTLASMTVNVTTDLEEKSVTYTATTAQQTDTITPASGKDGISRVNVTVNAIPVATPKSINETVTPNTPTISSTGLITATVTTVTGNIKPIQSAGYVDTNFSVPFASNGGSATLQLSTVAASTITPTETAQTAVPANKYTLGAVKVGAVSSTYVGSAIDRRDSTDLDIAGAMVTVPSGYYAEAASATIPAAVWKNASTVGVVPEISVSSSGLVTANASGWTSIHPLTSSGYADADTAANIQLAGSRTLQLDTLGATTYTPSTASQTINPGIFLTGAQTIDPIPSDYYDMSDPMSWLGKGLELVNGNLYNKEYKLKDTAWHGWTPSTTAKTCQASVSVSNAFTATDMANNEYVLVWDCGVDPVYTGTPASKAKVEFERTYFIQGLFRRANSWANVIAGNANANTCTQLSLSNFTRYYGTTTGTLTYTWNASYGLYFAAATSTFSNATAVSPTVTLKTPAFMARCSTTYFSTANAALIDEDASKLWIHCKLYRIKIKGYLRGMYDLLAQLVADGHTYA